MGKKNKRKNLNIICLDDLKTDKDSVFERCGIKYNKSEKEVNATNVFKISKNGEIPHFNPNIDYNKKNPFEVIGEFNGLPTEPRAMRKSNSTNKLSTIDSPTINIPEYDPNESYGDYDKPSPRKPRFMISSKFG